MGIMDETRSNPEIAGRFARQVSLDRSYIGSTSGVVVAFSILAATFSGCQTDHSAQDAINQMRSEKLALEDRYASLRNEYEKLRNRLAAKGDAAAQNPNYPSALPLVYPPGSSPLDIELGDPSGEQAWSLEEPAADGSTPTPQRAAVPQLGNGTSVLEGGRSDVAVPTATPTRIQLVDSQTRLTPGSSPNSFVLRIIARSMTELGEPANPVGTYSVRLINPRGVGTDSLIGTWQFPAEKIRNFVTNNPSAANDVPLEVGFTAANAAMPELVAEVDFHPVGGKKLTCRGFVGGGSNGDGPSKPWVDQLPVPQDARGLMEINNQPVQGPSATNAPAWSPVR